MLFRVNASIWDEETEPRLKFSWDDIDELLALRKWESWISPVSTRIFSRDETKVMSIWHGTL